MRHPIFRLLTTALFGAALALPASSALADHDPGHSAVREAFGDEPGEGWSDPFPAAAFEETAGGACPELLDHRIDDLRGRRVNLCAFEGKVLLVVNTASKCGYTPQYEGLEALYERYRERGLVVMGFPSNDFGGQEPGSNAEIAEFCEENYGVRFPMFTKVRVRGGNKAPFFAGLTAQETPQLPPGEIRWNFEKFLLDRQGKVVGRFRSTVKPESETLTAALERALSVN